MFKQYGFMLERYEGNVEIETLVTGDGKSTFSDAIHADGTVGLLIGYGTGTGIDTEVEIGSVLSKELQNRWQVVFDNQRSIDAMIKALLRLKNKLGGNQNEFRLRN